MSSKIYLQGSGSIIRELSPLHVGRDMNLNLSSSVKSAPIGGVKFNADSDLKLDDISENVSVVSFGMSEILKLSYSASNLISNTSFKVGGGMNVFSSLNNIISSIDFNAAVKAMVGNMENLKVESVKHGFDGIRKKVGKNILNIK